MALEAMVFPQNPFWYTSAMDFCTTSFVGGSSIQIHEEEIAETSSSDFRNWDSPHHRQPPPLDSSVPHQQFHNSIDFPHHKRRRAKSRRNREETENQRMTHITVERNRRKQMNDYLSVLRSLMPLSYIPRGDQASIIGGAINYVKELEQRVQFLSSHKNNESLHFSEFFNFPQYSTTASPQNQRPLPGIADIEVGMVESHVSIKIRTCKRRRQILMLVSDLQTLKLTVLHLNVTTKDQITLLTLSAKVEDACMLCSLDEIASAVHQLLCKIQQEALMSI